LGLVALDVADGERGELLLSILACVRFHTASSRHTATRAAALWGTLAAQIDEHTRTTANQVANTIPSEQLGALLSAYAEGRAAALLYTLTVHST
jgi:hypothetical protein